MELKSLVRKTLCNFGYDIRRTHSFRPNPIVTLGFNLVFDCGANRGQYAKSLRRDGYEGIIISIEPGNREHSDLRQLAARDSNWIVHERCALSDHVGEAVLNVASNSFSSSINTFKGNVSLPFSLSGQETVQVQTLDQLYDFYAKQNLKGKTLLKLDLQGHEAKALNGGERLLKACQGIQLELCIEPSYEDQATYKDFFSRLNAMGFELANIEPGFFDSTTGILREFDGLFLRQPFTNC